jgi:TRAP-type C4-dicarboxylate transport system substrate-binding protein
MYRKLLPLLIPIFAYSSAASAEEVTLRAISAFTEKTTYSSGMERFVERVNAAGKGIVQIN